MMRLRLGAQTPGSHLQEHFGRDRVYTVLPLYPFMDILCNGFVLQRV